MFDLIWLNSFAHKCRYMSMLTWASFNCSRGHACGCINVHKNLDSSRFSLRLFHQFLSLRFLPNILLGNIVALLDLTFILLILSLSSLCYILTQCICTCNVWTSFEFFCFVYFVGNDLIKLLKWKLNII